MRHRRPPFTWGLLAALLVCGAACSSKLASRLENGHTLTTAGIIAYYEGDLRAAERLLRSAVAHDYADTLARFYLARAYAARGGPDGRMAAEEALGDLTSIADEEPLYLVTLAQLRLRQGYRSNARRVLDRLVALDPDDTGALSALGRLAEGDWWHFQAARDRELATSFYRRVLEVDATHREANTRLAVMAIEADSLELARAHGDQLLEHHPEELETQLLEGVLQEYAGNFAAAQLAFRRALGMMADWDRAAFEGPTFLEPDSSLAFGPVWGGLEIGQADPGAGAAFWRRRDPTPATPVNERFVLHASRTAMADFLYGDPSRNVRGWETAPGEFYVRYGKPVRRTYVVGVSPVWLHTFDVGGRLVTMRFLDYGLNGNFMLPIEYDAAPLHAELRLRRPESAVLGDRVPVVTLPHALAWFRTAEGEPRLEVRVASEGTPLAYEAAILDSSWTEIYHVVQLTEPRPVPRGVPIPAAGLFAYTFYPGDRAARLEITQGETRTLAVDLGPPLPRSGFAVSGLLVGFVSGDELLVNPGFPIPSTSTIGIEFEVYDVQLDALGEGELEVTLSVIPHDGGRNRGLSRLLRGRGEPSFVTSTFVEEVTRRDWRRRIEIDPGELPTGRYTIRLEVEDELRRARAVREREVVIVARDES